MKSYGSYTFVLLKEQPSFTDGAAAMLNLSKISDRYNTSDTEQGADAQAVLADWLAIGDDMTAAIHEYESEQSFATK